MGVTQWKSSLDVIKWFKKIENKKNKRFLKLGMWTRSIFFSSPSPSPALASPSPSPGTIFESESESGKHVASPPSPSPPSPSAAIFLTSQQINRKLIFSKNFV